MGPPPEFLIHQVWSGAKNMHFQQGPRDSEASGSGTTALLHKWLNDGPKVGLGKQTQKERIGRALTKLPMGEFTPGGAAPLWEGGWKGD